MIPFNHITGFEWDEGNLDKSYKKHGILTSPQFGLQIGPASTTGPQGKSSRTVVQTTALLVTPKESEEIFLDEKLKILKDIKHFQQEERFIGLGITCEKKILFVVFTLRKNKIRIISARKANGKEEKIYDEKRTKKNTPL